MGSRPAPLAPRQRDVLQYVERYARRHHGDVPTVRELCDYLGCTRQNANVHLRTLANLGYLQAIGASGPRRTARYRLLHGADDYAYRVEIETSYGRRLETVHHFPNYAIALSQVLQVARHVLQVREHVVATHVERLTIPRGTGVGGSIKLLPVPRRAGGA